MSRGNGGSGSYGGTGAETKTIGRGGSRLASGHPIRPTDDPTVCLRVGVYCRTGTGPSVEPSPRLPAPRRRVTAGRGAPRSTTDTRDHCRPHETAGPGRRLRGTLSSSLIVGTRCLHDYLLLAITDFKSRVPKSRESWSESFPSTVEVPRKTFKETEKKSTVLPPLSPR